MSSCSYWTIQVLGPLICGLLPLLVLFWPLVLVYLLLFQTCFALVVLQMVCHLTHWVLLLCCLFRWPLILCLVYLVLWTLFDTLIIFYWCELNWVVLRGLLPPVLRLYVQQQSLRYTDGQSASLPSSQLQGELVMLYQMLRPWGVTQVATSSKDLRMI